MGRLGTVLGASWAVLERRDDEKARTLKSFKHLFGKSMILASWGPLGKNLGARLGCLGGLLGRLEAVLGVLGRSFGDSRVLGPSWGPLGALLARLGALLALENPRGDARERAGAPGKLENFGPQPLEY